MTPPALEALRAKQQFPLRATKASIAVAKAKKKKRTGFMVQMNWYEVS